MAMTAAGSKGVSPNRPFLIIIAKFSKQPLCLPKHMVVALGSRIPKWVIHLAGDERFDTSPREKPKTLQALPTATDSIGAVHYRPTVTLDKQMKSHNLVVLREDPFDEAVDIRSSQKYGDCNVVFHTKPARTLKSPSLTSRRIVLSTFTASLVPAVNPGSFVSLILWFHSVGRNSLFIRFDPAPVSNTIMTGIIT